MRRAVLPVLAAVVAVVTGCSADTPPPPDEASSAGPSAGPAEPSPLPVQRFDALSNAHVDGEVDYEQSPPVGGDHNSRWLACGVYDEQPPDELAVHALEHGAVWLTYRPDLPAADVAELVELAASEQEYVLVTPYEPQAAPVVATAWGLQLPVQSAADPLLADVVRAYAGGDQGGEPGAPCRQGGLSLEQARAALGG